MDDPLSQTIRVLADYNCYPLWLAGQEGYENVSPDKLGLSSKLRQAINDWAEEYDQTYNDADPASSGFRTGDAEKRHSARGEELATRVKEELGEGYSVSYFNGSTMKDVPID